MKKLLFSLLVLGTLSTYASILEVNGPLDSKFHEAEVSQDKSHYETLGDLFSNGTLPNLSRISNIAWSGRCFLKDKPNDPINAGYIFRQKSTSDAGPIGQNVKAYEAFSYWNIYGDGSQNPSFFDNMSIEQVFAWGNLLISRNAKIESNQIAVRFSSTMNSSLKSSGSYLIEEISEAESDAGPLAKTSIPLRCYYFIPDLNK